MKSQEVASESSVADDVAFWRERAASTRVAAWAMPEERCRDATLAIAASYERVAIMAQARVTRRAAMVRARFAFNLAAPIAGGLGLALACVGAWLSFRIVI